VAAAWIVEAVDVFKDRHLGLPSGLPWMPPDQFSFDGLEERLDCRIIVTIALTAHRYLEPMLAQDLLIIVRTILRPAIRVMDAAFGWSPERDGHLQSPDRKVTLHTVTDSPANNAP